ncbi:MAG: sugar phosphate nucleotidyltransferase, partial [Candidatus Gracilibacteria bacterium]|nr:sugar phosphate nucleotidyltransferase [Candidatus Gracilibacteria bacterium]
MKAIILVAGEGSRLRPLTETKPKPLIKIFGKTIIEYNLENLKDFVDEFIIVVKYEKEKIIEKFGYEYAGIKVTYHEQGDIKGTGGAIKGMKIEDDVLIINGDSILGKEDIEKIVKNENYCVLVKEVENPNKYG